MLVLGQLYNLEDYMNSLMIYYTVTVSTGSTPKALFSKIGR